MPETKAKLANLATHDQRERQDERHVRILIRCCAHYLTDACAAVHAGDLAEREAVERFMTTHRVTTSEAARRLERKFALGISGAIPERDSLGKSGELRRIHTFYDHQIEGKTK